MRSLFFAAFVVAIAIVITTDAGNADDVVPELAQIPEKVRQAHEHLLDCGWRAALQVYAAEDKDDVSSDIKDAFDKMDALTKKEPWAGDLVKCVEGTADLASCHLSVAQQKKYFDGQQGGPHHDEKNNIAFYNAVEKLHDEMGKDSAFVDKVRAKQHDVCPEDHLGFAALALDNMDSYNAHGDKTDPSGAPNADKPDASDPLPEVGSTDQPKTVLLQNDEEEGPPTPNCDACMKKQTAACESASGLCEYKEFKLKCITEHNKVADTEECKPGKAKFEPCLDTCKVEQVMDLPTGHNTPGNTFNPSGGDAPGRPGQ
jgi:hypothetical protein